MTYFNWTYLRALQNNIYNDKNRGRKPNQTKPPNYCDTSPSEILRLTFTLWSESEVEETQFTGILLNMSLNKAFMSVFLYGSLVLYEQKVQIFFKTKNILESMQ